MSKGPSWELNIYVNTCDCPLETLIWKKINYAAHTNMFEGCLDIT